MNMNHVRIEEHPLYQRMREVADPMFRCLNLPSAEIATHCEDITNYLIKMTYRCLEIYLSEDLGFANWHGPTAETERERALYWEFFHELSDQLENCVRSDVDAATAHIAQDLFRMAVEYFEMVECKTNQLSAQS